MRRLEGRPVVRSPQQLRLHRALDEIGWTGVIGELNDAAQLKNQSVSDPILITTNGTILAGFGIWRLAIFEGKHQIHCIEYLLGEEAALEFILTHYQPRRAWNAFIRIRLALTLEPYLQQQALEKMRAVQAQMSARYGLRVGVIAILYTFNGQLKFNSHVHTMVTGEGCTGRLTSGLLVPTTSLTG